MDNRQDPADYRRMVEQASEQFVMLDIGDLPAMAFFCKHLRALSDAVRSVGDPGVSPALVAACAEAAGRASERVQGIILEESKNATHDMAVVEKIITALQSLLCQGRPAAFPEELNLALPPLDGGAKSENTLTAPDPATIRSSIPTHTGGAGAVLSLAPGVDDEIFKAFIEQQVSVLPEMEEKILAYEKDGAVEHLAGLRRLLHTMKGEAGVMGLNGLQGFCHRVEDYLQVNGHVISADALIEVKDWLSQAVQALAEGKAPESGAEILKRLTTATGAEETGNSKLETGKSPTTVGLPSDGSFAAGASSPDSPTPVSSVQCPVSTHSIEIADPDLARDFVNESREHFDAADENLLILENEPTNQEAIGAVFRAFHTVKGVCGFLGLPPIGNLAHKAETLLDEVRKGKRSFTGATVDVTFSALDMLKGLVSDLGADLKARRPFSPRPELPDVMASLTAILAGKESAASGKGQAGRGKSETENSKPDVATGVKDSGAMSGKLETPETEPALPAVLDKEAESSAPQSAIRNPQSVDAGSGTVKIDAERLDLLIDSIGELVIAESIVAQDPEVRALHSQRLEKNLSHMGKITRTLQDMSMAMRMVPVDATFRKMVRLVRDLAKKGNKKIELVMVGNETELDRGMVEKLGDPLVHMIRNSVDHGIEATAEDRIRAGKPATGHITLKAYHKGGSINIEIADDGRGLDRDAILQKGLERGVVKPGQNLTDSEIYALIFEAGFSTAKQVTEISGRGVGMDVVRRNIENLRGNVQITTELGKGTTFTLVLPLTMAIIDGMAVKVGEETYILPTLSIMESLRPLPEMLTTVTGRGEMVQFRGNLIPLFRLSRLFDVPGAREKATEGIVMVLEDAGRRTGVLVDEILGQQQTVIKSLGEAIGQIPGVSGASIMADGRPGLILDVAGIVKIATG